MGNVIRRPFSSGTEGSRRSQAVVGAPPAGGALGNTNPQGGGGGTAGVTQIVAGAGMSVSPAGGTGVVTVTNTSSSFTTYVYPESYGAVADGVTDDSAAIYAAYAAVTSDQSLFLSGTYGIGTAAQTAHSLPSGVYFDSAKSVMSNGRAIFQPSTSSPATNCLTIGPINLEGYLTLPGINGFTGGYGLRLDCTNLGDFTLGFINACAVGIELVARTGSGGTTACLDNTIHCQSIFNCTTAAIQMSVKNASGSVFMQGNRIDTNFVNGCKRWVYMPNFSLTTNDVINQNTFSCDAFDADNIGSIIAIDNQSGTTQAQNTFLCRGFWGGFVAGDIWVNGSTNTKNFDESDFIFGTMPAPAGTTAQQYAAMQNNEYIFSWGSMYRGLGSPKWINNTGISCSTTINTRSTFNGGNATMANSVLLSFDISSLASGATQTYYAYHPFVQGCAKLRLGPSPDQGTTFGMMVDTLTDNSGTNPNEILITLRNVSGSAIPGSTTCKMLLTAGIP